MLLEHFQNLLVSQDLRGGYLATNKFLAKQLFNLKPMYEINSLGILIIKEFIKKKISKNYTRQTLIGKNFLLESFKK